MKIPRKNHLGIFSLWQRITRVRWYCDKWTIPIHQLWRTAVAYAATTVTQRPRASAQQIAEWLRWRPVVLGQRECRFKSCRHQAHFSPSPLFTKPTCLYCWVTALSWQSGVLGSQVENNLFWWQLQNAELCWLPLNGQHINNPPKNQSIWGGYYQCSNFEPGSAW